MENVKLMLGCFSIYFFTGRKSNYRQDKKTPNSIIQEQLSRLRYEINQAIDLMITLLPKARRQQCFRNVI
jgi:hypothetical protein